MDKVDNTEKILQLMHDKYMSYNEAQDYLMEQEYQKKLNEWEADESMWRDQHYDCDRAQSNEDYWDAYLDYVEGCSC